MKPTELMIGDWVRVKRTQKIVKVKEIRQSCIYTEDNGYEYNEIEPIPLTKESLKKNGFGSVTDEMFSACETETYSNQELKIYLSHIGCEYNPVQLVVYMGYEPQERIVLRMMPCQYVHELQHALRICGITKEIEL